jgi:prevent-host-death family protein
MMIWQLQEAKSKFSQIVNRALREGPQIVTRHGQEVVVVLSVEEYRKMIESRPTLLDLLLNAHAVDVLRDGRTRGVGVARA